MFARSAPVEAGGLPRDRLRGRRPAASGLPRVCTRGSRSRPGEVGRRDEHLAVEAARAQQRRVEVLDAGSSAPMTTTWSRRPKPSSSTRSWLSVWSCSRLKPLPLRAAPTASSSSMKTIDGRVLARLVEELADARPRRGRRTSRRTPTRSARRSCAPDSLATAFASERLAGAGRAVEQDPLRHARAERARSASGRGGSRRPPGARPSRSSTPATSVQRDRRLRVGARSCFGFTLRHQLDRAPGIR